MNANPLLEKLASWLRTITLQVQLLYLYRRIFTEVDEIVQQNPGLDHDHIYFGFLANTYVDSLVSGVRRQLKEKDESISLTRFLRVLSQHPEIITREYFFAHYARGESSPAVRSVRDQQWARFAEPNAIHIDGRRIVADLENLKRIANKSEEYADKRIAHWDIKPPGTNLTLDEIYKSVDELGELVKTYDSLFFGSHLFVRPALPYPIAGLFDQPWRISKVP